MIRRDYCGAPVIFKAGDGVTVVLSGEGGAILFAARGGLLDQKQTPESLARVLRDALELDQEQRARLIRNGRSWMARNCGPETHGEVLSTILTSACGSSG
jgi:hypothetical protein